MHKTSWLNLKFSLQVIIYNNDKNCFDNNVLQNSKKKWETRIIAFVWIQ